MSKACNVLHRVRPRKMSLSMSVDFLERLEVLAVEEVSVAEAPKLGEHAVLRAKVVRHESGFELVRQESDEKHVGIPVGLGVGQASDVNGVLQSEGVKLELGRQALEDLAVEPWSTSSQRKDQQTARPSGEMRPCAPFMLILRGGLEVRVLITQRRAATGRRTK